MMKSIWKFFTSTRLAVVLSLLITIDVLTGTILLSSSPKALGAIDLEIFFYWLFGAGLNNLTASWWIFLLLILLALFVVNTIVCTVDSIVFMLRPRRDAARIKPRRILSQAIHLGFIIGLLGHLVSSASGFRTMDNRLFEGSSIPMPQSSELSLRLNKLDVAFTKNGDMQRMDAYLSLIRDKGVVKDKVVRLNEPLLYQGNAVYITHHGEAPESMKFELSGNGTQEIIKIKLHEKSVTSSRGYTLKLEGLIPDFARDSKGKVYSASKQYRNPALEVKVYKGEKFLVTGWFLLQYPDKTPLAFDGLKLVFSGLTYRPYAILTINRDPGAVIVLSGALIFIISLIWLLFIKGEGMELVKRQT
ncbi:MAG TPA: hypothetical protein ENG90_08290 [Gammaproteobacteria bacterium]|nr:cytochrome c biogenesis protein Ccs1 [bacterium BMS3Abin11]GMT41531.1 MAG: hypothetical protein IEMM0001_2266 [bacterium]HDH16463.1 hypothetical protein [Gammaproteobacteria bacterium]